MKFVLASGNPHKAQELQALAAAAALDVTIVAAAAAGGMPRVHEDAGTFVGNARKKAAALRARLGPDAWVLADDSGLCVEALGGAPGVESAYFAGPAGDDAANLAKLRAVLRDVPDGRRGAYYVCVLLALGPGGAEQVFEGVCHGRLLREPRGAAGFGYDPLFVPVGRAETFAEMSEPEKNRLSHRGHAWTRFAEWLRRG